jgi:serine/threonine protein kinase
VRVSFERAARDLREVHAFRPAPPPVRLRHPPPPDAARPTSAASERRRARNTTAAALGVDASGAKCVNQYVKLRKLGQGSYAKVVLYRSREDDTLYAIKIMSRSALCRRHVSRGASALADAMREARAALAPRAAGASVHKQASALTRAVCARRCHCVSLRVQVAILRALDHPNIVRLEEVRLRFWSSILCAQRAHTSTLCALSRLTKHALTAALACVRPGD